MRSSVRARSQWTITALAVAVRTSGGTLLHTEDMYAAIDALTDKLDRQLRKHKGKAKGRQQAPAPRPADS